MEGHIWSFFYCMLLDTIYFLILSLPGQQRGGRQPQHRHRRFPFHAGVQQGKVHAGVSGKALKGPSFTISMWHISTENNPIKASPGAKMSNISHENFWCSSMICLQWTLSLLTPFMGLCVYSVCWMELGNPNNLDGFFFACLCSSLPCTALLAIWPADDVC